MKTGIYPLASKKNFTFPYQSNATFLLNTIWKRFRNARSDLRVRAKTTSHFSADVLFGCIEKAWKCLPNLLFRLASRTPAAVEICEVIFARTLNPFFSVHGLMSKKNNRVKPLLLDMHRTKAAIKSQKQGVENAPDKCSLGNSGFALYGYRVETPLPDEHHTLFQSPEQV